MTRSDRERGDLTSVQLAESNACSTTMRSAPREEGFTLSTPSGLVPFDPLMSIEVLRRLARHARARLVINRTKADAASERRSRALHEAAREALADARRWLAMHTSPVDSFPADRIVDADREGPIFLDEVATSLETTAEQLKQVHSLLSSRRPAPPTFGQAIREVISDLEDEPERASR